MKRVNTPYCIKVSIVLIVVFILVYKEIKGFVKKI